jgi:replicative DNA helicase
MDRAPQYRLQDLVIPLLNDYERRRRAMENGSAPGPVTGIADLDKELGGALSPGIHVLQAAPSAGKTALALHLAAESGYPALFVSAEMGAIPLFSRVIARHTRTPLATVCGTAITSDELAVLADITAVELSQIVILDSTAYPASPAVLADISTQIANESGNPPVLVVDSVQAWARIASSISGYLNEYDGIVRSMRLLMEIAHRFTTPVIAVSQRNRAGQEKGGIHASKGTGDIEYAAESVLELKRELSQQPDARGEVEVEIVILKNRNGTAGSSIRLMFHGSTQTFRAVGSRHRRR